MRAATGVRVAWSSRLVSVDPRWVPLWWHCCAIKAEGVRVHILRCDRVKHRDVLAALGLLDMVIKSSGSGMSLHLLGGEGILGHATVVASPLMDLSVDCMIDPKKIVAHVGAGG